MEMPVGQFELFQKLLVDSSGLYFPPERADQLLEKLEERMRAVGVPSVMAYHSLLGGPKGEEELKSLLDILTIGETYFFRNEPQFNALKNHIIPALLQSQAQENPGGRRRLRIWCAGCSTGEEPYSIAMMLTGMPDVDSWDISILATDINRHSLAAAQKGLYSERSVHLVPEHFLERYFRKNGTKFELSDEIKKKVVFKYHNLASDDYRDTAMQDLHLLVCRNVTIYFGRDTLKKILDKFAGCLIDDGHLVLGHSETLWDACTLFEPVEFTDTFLYKKALKNRRRIEPVHIPIPPVEALAAIDANPPPAVQAPKSPGPADAIRATAFEAIKKQNVAEGLFLLEMFLISHPEDMEARLTQATLRANSGEYEAALSSCGEILRRDDLSLPAFYLMGVILDRMGQYEKSIEVFRRVLFLDSTLAVCYLHLGNLLKRLGKFTQAQKEFSNCVKLLAHLKGDSEVAFSDGLTVSILTQAAKAALENCRAQGSLVGVKREGS